MKNEPIRDLLNKAIEVADHYRTENINLKSKIDQANIDIHDLRNELQMKQFEINNLERKI